MKVEIGSEITAETIFKKVETGEVTSILENSVVIENGLGRHVIKRDVLKKAGYEVGKPPVRKNGVTVIRSKDKKE